MIIKPIQISNRDNSGVFEIQFEPKKDNRGWFMRTYDKKIFEKYLLNNHWVQENHSYTKKINSIRGLHYQRYPYTETKLVRCVRGQVLDVFLDIRNDSPTFGKWGSIILSENKNAVYISRGFAHGYRTLEDNCEIFYKVDNYYSQEYESGIRWDDPNANIDWQFTDNMDKDNIIISEKDSKLKSFREARLL